MNKTVSATLARTDGNPSARLHRRSGRVLPAEPVEDDLVDVAVVRGGRGPVQDEVPRLVRGELVEQGLEVELSLSSRGVTWGG